MLLNYILIDSGIVLFALKVKLKTIVIIEHVKSELQLDQKAFFCWFPKTTCLTSHSFCYNQSNAHRSLSVSDK